MLYQESDIVQIAQRENNKKRNYLVVNRLQGKHVPVEPGQALAMFRVLAELLKEAYAGERLLVIGFAETATAIGAAIAAELGSYYIQTTREEIPGVDYLFFTEEHSHATEQKLVKNDLDQVIGRIDRIVFAEDEVTTGKTIFNIINILEKQYPGQASFAAASILNGMDEEALELYKNRRAALHYLVKTDHQAYAEAARRYVHAACAPQAGMYVPCREGCAPQTGMYVPRREGCAPQTGMYIPCRAGCAEAGKEKDATLVKDTECMKDTTWMKDTELIKDTTWMKDTESIKDITFIKITGWMNARRLVSASEYEAACIRLWHEIDGRLHEKLRGRVLVLGTEEFMYPALFTAAEIAKQGADVKCHSTTRSPILVYEDSSYPLHARYELASLYDRNRKTFLYDIDAYDVVLIITDAPVDMPADGLDDGQEGIRSLIDAVLLKNENIYVIRWC